MTTVEATRPIQGPPLHATVCESAEGYTIALDVGDFALSELEVTLDDRVVTVTAEEIETAEDDVVSFRFDERLEETFTLPDDADPQHVEAFYRQGTLEIRAQKRMSLPPRIVPIRRRSEPLVNADATPC